MTEFKTAGKKSSEIEQIRGALESIKIILQRCGFALGDVVHQVLQCYRRLLEVLGCTLQRIAEIAKEVSSIDQNLAQLLPFKVRMEIAWNKLESFKMKWAPKSRF